MSTRLIAAFGLATLLAAPATAEVRSAANSGFESEHRFDTALPPADLYRLLTDIKTWWSDSHTYSGKAANLSLDAKAGGCWCETMPDGGGVEHMRVVQVMPGKRIVMLGSLGPLVNEATAGAMVLTIEPQPAGSRLVMNYRVAGFYKADGGRLANAVDEVLGTQIKKLQAQADALARAR